MNNDESRITVVFAYAGVGVATPTVNKCRRCWLRRQLIDTTKKETFAGANLRRQKYGFAPAKTMEFLPTQFCAGKELRRISVANVTFADANIMRRQWTFLATKKYAGENINAPVKKSVTILWKTLLAAQ